MTHPLLGVLLDAAQGKPPEPDGSVEVLPPLPGPADALVSFTAHCYVAAAIDAKLVRSRLPAGDPGAPTRPGFLAWLAEQLGSQAGYLDALLVAPGLEGPPPLDLELRTDLEAHPRVARASRYRSDLRVLSEASGDGVVVVGRGVAGRWEVAFEVEPAARDRGLGRALARAARHLLPRGEPLFAQVTPGNVASFRVLLAAGYQPVASEVLYPRNRRGG